MQKVYNLVPNYTMKCRIYPNKTCAENIDNAIKGIQCFYNCTIYDIFTNYSCTTEKEGKDKDGKNTGKKVHFLKSGDIGKADRKNRLAHEHPIIECVPAGAISSSVYGISCDIKKSIGNKPIEYQKPNYYNNKHPRRSYSYQEIFSKITVKDNRNVLYINLNKIGVVKIRGWNQSIRFDGNGTVDFVEYAVQNKRKQVGVIISKDNCGDYWICFKLQNVYLKSDVNTYDEVGIDVGIKDIMILSNGTKYQNKRFKQANKQHERKLHKQLSRRLGWSNIKYRTMAKEERPEVSKSYLHTQLQLARLERKIKRQREYYNNCITKEIVMLYGFIGVETLNVSGMFRNKHLAYALADASMGTILQMLKYKAEWYNREIQNINQWTPSSKKCSCCGHIMPFMPLNVRDWTCPQCSEHHDRDINAARNILYYAKLEKQS